jgi:hypothetical protein
MGTIPHTQPDDDTIDAMDPARSTRLAQAALAAARLVIARSQLTSRVPPTVQGRWYAQVQNNLQAWRNAGGFAQEAQAGIVKQPSSGGAGGTPHVSGCVVG